MQRSVFVFSGEKNHLPSAVFSTEETARKWIRDNKLSGTLTEYPIDDPIYDWTIRGGYFEPRRDDQRSADFIANFSSAHQNHFHFEEGEG